MIIPQNRKALDHIKKLNKEYNIINTEGET